MKKRVLLLALVFAFFLTLSLGSVLAESWPASREELAAENLIETNDSMARNGQNKLAAEKFAEHWVQKNYGDDVTIISTERIGEYSTIDISKLLNGSQALALTTWEMTIRNGTHLEGIDRSEDGYVVSTQVVCLMWDDRHTFDKEYTLVGFLPPGETFQDLYEVRDFLQMDPRFTDSLAPLHTIVPQGVTEIDLRTMLGDKVFGIEDAWMLNEEVCLLLHRLPDEDGVYPLGSYNGYEIILLDLQTCSILSQTQVPLTQSSWYQQYWEGGIFCLQLMIHVPIVDDWEDMDWKAYDNDVYRKVSVSPDGKVNIGDVTEEWYTIMPGDKQAVFTADDGSLWAVDLASGEETLLVQGRPYVVRTPAGDAYLESFVKLPEYIPVEDELPIEEDWDLVRVFYAVRPLDEYRFVYKVGSWESSSGYGIYDLQTNTDHRITGLGDFFGVRGDRLFGASLQANADTYQSSPLPKGVREQLYQVSFSFDDIVNCDISQSGKLLALTGMVLWSNGSIADWWKKSDTEPTFDYAHTVTVTDIQTGDVIKIYDIVNSFATESKVSFYDDTRLLLLCKPDDLGSAYLYLFDIEQ